MPQKVEDIIADFVSILYSFCARLYGQRRAKRKTEKIVQDLNVKAEQKTVQEAGEERAAS
jgi:predicted site-specific integrase-resolvase